MRGVVTFLVLASICVARVGSAEGFSRDAFRHELRAFYPDWGQGDKDIVRDPRQARSFTRIESDLRACCAANPNYDALDVRRECYRAMQRHFVPFVFKESPFYFEAGVNGGWGGKRPASAVSSSRTCSSPPAGRMRRIGARSSAPSTSFRSSL